MPENLTPEQLLQAYANGYFPMAMDKHDPELYWFSPEERGVIPLDNFHIPRGLKRALKSRPYTITTDQDFNGVIRACATAPRSDKGTWINDTIIDLYNTLHGMGYAHSIEVWAPNTNDAGRPRVASHGEPEPKANEGGAVAMGDSYPPRGEATNQQAIPEPKTTSQPTLIGGLYGVSLGGAFFGESMFSRAADASKIALVALVDILNEAGYTLLDTQYVNDHLKQFGVVAVPKETYMIKLENALNASPNPSSLFSTASVRKGFASASSASNT